MDGCGDDEACFSGKSGELSRVVEVSAGRRMSLISHCQEKSLRRAQAPVPQTDTGRQEENSKVSERTIVKELGKMTP